ncbi:MAG: hypothetical protein DRI90_08750 [Deltaproteobacteria bacterium]|nr:MAG: hypothetical protein DRI90_08750 [Deltaproteobacteria bacterium]
MGGHGASIAFAILLVASLSGCVHRWVLSEPPPASSQERGTPSVEDLELHQLLTARRQLAERLQRVEQQLATLVSQPRDLGGKVEALLNDRLSITIALANLDRAIEWRRDELVDLASRPSPGDRAAARSTDPAKLVARAAEQIADHRRAASELFEGPPLQGLFDTTGDGEGGLLADVLTGGGSGAVIVDGLATKGDRTRGGKDGEGDLDALLGSAAGKGRTGSRATAGKRKGAPEKRSVEPGPGDGNIHQETTVEAAVVSAGAPPPEVMPAVRRKRAPLMACLPRELLDAGVRITVRARIATDGSFRAPRITATPELSPDISACVTDVLQRIQLPPQSDSRSVRFSLVFQGS